MSKMIACVGCGEMVPDVEVPGHRYIGSSPGCWAMFGEVLAREYSDYRFARAHRLTVDAFGVQHPGEPSPHAIASVAVHLLHLYWVIEMGYDTEHSARLMQRSAEHKKEFHWLTPPESLGAITVKYVHEARGPEEHLERVRAWAEEMWRVWRPHHETVRSWARLIEAAPVSRRS